ncbi:MAG: hypothetical protein ACERKD_24660 [Prolixibacteraceae bacterium]
MKNAHLFSIMIISLFFNIQLEAKSLGKFKKYTQITDKEVLMESTKGVKILFTAFDNKSIGISYYDKNENVYLITPANISNHQELRGSIYIEQLDELMQITSTTSEGLLIKVNKKEFGFTFIDKSNNREINVEEDLLAKIVSNEKSMLVTIASVEEPNHHLNPTF